MEEWGWIFWLPVLGFPSHKAINIFYNFPDHLQLSELWEDFLEHISIAAFMAISVSVIFLWPTVLVVVYPVCQVHLQHISQRIRNVWKETVRRLAQDISVKINNSKKCLRETKGHNSTVFDKAMKFKLLKSEDVKSEFTDLHSRAFSTKQRMLEEKRKKLEKSCNRLNFAQATWKAEFKLISVIIDICYEIQKLEKAVAEMKAILELERKKRYPEQAAPMTPRPINLPECLP